MSNYTIKDISRMAGVSISTVSRYINGKYEFMSEDTRERIKTIIEQSNYEPNSAARNLKLRKNKTIAFVYSEFNQPSIKDILGAIHTNISPLGYQTMIFDSGSDPENEKKILNTCSRQVDGIVFRPISTDLRIYNRLLSQGVPVVLFDRMVSSWQYDAVYFDHEGGALKMMDHLFENGYRDVYFLETHANPASTKISRKNGYLKYMTDYYGKDFDKEQFLIRLPEDFDSSDCENCFRRILDHKKKFGPKAVFYDAQYFIKYLPSVIKKLGIRVPEELGICGYDYDNWGESLTPSITTLDLPQAEMVSMCLDILYKRIEEAGSGSFDAEQMDVKQIKIDIDLIKRESTAKVRS